jgi:hypothetical protein
MHHLRCFAATDQRIFTFIFNRLDLASEVQHRKCAARARGRPMIRTGMICTGNRPIRTFSYVTLSLLTLSGLALAQDQPRGWRRATDPAPNQAPDQAEPQAQSQAQAQPQAQPASPDWQNQPGEPDNGGPQAQPPQQGMPPTYQPDGGGAPSRLTLKGGTYLTVRINQPLSSDHNQAGDAFSASLVRPLVVDGIVVAQTGQMVSGRVAEAQKAGRVTGTSRLGLQLTDLTLVDGQQLPIHSQLITRNGNTSEGRDAAAIAGTTGLGAAIGATAGWGRGAAIGAGAGAVAGVVGVLLTRGQPTVVYPETVLTFRIEQPVTIATDRAPQAFRYVEPGDYAMANQGQVVRRGPGPGGPPPGPGFYGPGYYPYYASPYPYYPYGGFFWGPGFYFRGGFYYRGYRR